MRYSPADLECDVIAPVGDHRASVIWLHGMGQDSHTVASVAQDLDLANAGVRSICPRAPEQSASVMTGVPVRAWMDQHVLALDEVDLDTLAATEAKVRRIVAAEAARVGASRVAIAGFSQGATMALITGLRYPETLSGLVLYAPLPVPGVDLPATRSQANAHVPIWIGHGRFDWVVPMVVGEQVRDVLAAWGHPVSWNLCRSGHEPFVGAPKRLRGFLDEVLLTGGETR